MRIYVSHPRSFDYENDLYRPIREHFADSGHVFLFPHENGADEDLRSLIASCQLVIAEVSEPATGVGIELGRAEAAGVPIVCIHKRNTVPSGSLPHVCSDIYGYDTREELLMILERIVGDRIERHRQISA